MIWFMLWKIWDGEQTSDCQGSQEWGPGGGCGYKRTAQRSFLVSEHMLIVLVVIQIYTWENCTELYTHVRASARTCKWNLNTPNVDCQSPGFDIMPHLRRMIKMGKAEWRAQDLPVDVSATSCESIITSKLKLKIHCVVKSYWEYILKVLITRKNFF